jgi:hypothetical protein
MIRLVLIVVLIAATDSARNAALKEVRRDATLYETCYGHNPFQQCIPTESDYPIIMSLQRARNLTEKKRILLSDNTIEDLCDEARQNIDCFISHAKKVSAECAKMYATQGLSSETFEKIGSLRTLICDKEVIKAIRDNLDCILTTDLTEYGEKCLRPNIDMNCSQFESSGDKTALRKCYLEKFRPNCNLAEVLKCTANPVIETCDEDAGDLVALIGNAYFERFPVCTANRPYHHLEKMLKFFKK